MSRFAEAGERLHHIPEILYHWRTHDASSSNSGLVSQRSLDSVRFMLKRVIARQREPSLYEVAFWPIARGFEQYTILRRQVGVPPVTLLAIGNDNADGGILGPSYHLDQEAALTVEWLRELEADIVLVLSAGVVVPTQDAIWEAVRLFEMHGDVGAVGGRVLDANGIVIETCVPIRSDPATDWVGRHRTDGADYAHVLKPQSVVALPQSVFFCRAEILRDAAALNPADKLAARVADRCRVRALRLAYSPLIEATSYQATDSMRSA